MKIIIKFFLLLFFTTLPPTLTKTFTQPGTCTPIKYSRNGEECNPQQNKFCKDFLSCSNGKCIPGHIGAECEKNTDCYLSSLTSESIRCINKICIKPKYNGYPCSSNEECFGKNCHSGICSGKPIGSACDPTNFVECEKGFYCSQDTRTCQKQKKLGENCGDFFSTIPNQDPPIGTNFHVICPGGSKCIAFGSPVPICRPYQQKSTGELCENNYECISPLICSGGSVHRCTLPRTNSIPCIGSPRNCSEAENEICVCEQGGGGSCKSVLSLSKCGYFNAAKNWEICRERYNCPHDGEELVRQWSVESFQESKSCMSSNCGGLSREVLCCMMREVDQFEYSSAYVEFIPSCLGQAWISGVAIFLVVVGIVSMIVSGGIIVGIILRENKSWFRSRGESFEALK